MEKKIVGRKSKADAKKVVEPKAPEIIVIKDEYMSLARLRELRDKEQK